MIKKLLNMLFKQETVEQTRERISKELRETAKAGIGLNWMHQARDRREVH